MILSEIINFLDLLFRKELELEADNSGFLIGRTHKDVKKILIALDATDEVIDEAIKLQAGLLIVHHPLIYDPLKNITSQEQIQSKILKLIENGIAVYAAHTNYDVMPGGLNQLIAEKIGLKNIVILEPFQGIDNPENKFANAGIGRVGNLESEKTLKDLLEELKKRLDLENLQWLSNYPSVDFKRIIKRVAVVNGGANSSAGYLSSPWFLPDAGGEALDAVIVGELKYSNALKIAESGIIVIAVGHAESEKMAIAGMAEIILNFLESNNINNDIEVLKSKTGYLPWRYYFERK
jgi:dinuclear metal center YbgI/SA1388 family protein